MQATEIEKSKMVELIKVVDYVPNTVVNKTLFHKVTGNISILAIDSGGEINPKISPFDTYLQILEGEADIIIDGRNNLLQAGQAIIIPAHISNMVRAKVASKMILVVIKSGYEGNEG